MCGILRETCSALWAVLQPEYVGMPSSKDDWNILSQQFESIWNFQNCIGMIAIPDTSCCLILQSL